MGFDGLSWQHSPNTPYVSTAWPIRTSTVGTIYTYSSHFILTPENRYKHRDAGRKTQFSTITRGPISYNPEVDRCEYFRHRLIAIRQNRISSLVMGRLGSSPKTCPTVLTVTNPTVERPMCLYDLSATSQSSGSAVAGVAVTGLSPHDLDSRQEATFPDA